MQPTVLLAVWQQLSLPVIFPSLCYCLVSVCYIHLSTQVTASLLLPNEPEGETRERKRKRVYLELYISFKTKSWTIQWTSPVHFCKTVLCDLSKNLVPYSWPIRYKWNVTRELFTNVLPSLPWVFFRLLIKTFWCCSSCRIQCKSNKCFHINICTYVCRVTGGRISDGLSQLLGLSLSLFQFIWYVFQALLQLFRDFLKLTYL